MDAKVDHYHIDKARVRASFGRAASSYDAAAILQKQVREEMLSRLDWVTLNPETILDAGCGTGAASHALRKRYAGAQVLSMDFALAMLQKTRERGFFARLLMQFKGLIGRPRHHLLCADLEQLPLANNSVDLLWSNLAMQWCNDLDATFSECQRVLRPQGLLMFSTFGPDTLKELRAASHAYPGVTSVSRFIDMHDIGDALIRAGFSAPVLDVERYTLTYDDIKSLMRDLKSIGAHNATDGRARGLLGRGFLAKLAAAYEAYRVAGKLPATYEVVYGHAWRAEDKPALADGVSPIAFRARTK